MRRLFFLLLPLGLLASACGDVSGYAAKVNDTTISREDLDGDIEAITDNPEVLQALEQSLGPQEQIRGAGQGTVDIAFALQLLQRRINAAIIHQEIERRGLEVTEQDLQQARQQAEQQVFGDPELFQQLAEGFREDLVRQFAETNVLQQALGEEGSGDEVLRRQFEEDPARFEERCVSHILLENQEAAQAVRARIAAGADFAEAARAESKDPQTAPQGGTLECLTTEEAQQLVPEFRDVMLSLAPGEVSQPVQTSFGWHLIKVTEVRPRSFEDAVQQLRQEQGQETALALQQLVTELVREAEIRVNPRYGRFSKEELRIIPPEGPGVATTTTLPLTPE